MSKQIKIIWILSLISVLLLIGMQGYWLYNQYEYTLNLYSEEIAMQVLQAGEEEFQERKEGKPLFSTYMMREKTDSSSQKYRVILNATITEPQRLTDSPAQPDERIEFWANRQARPMGDRPPIELGASIRDTTQFIVSFDTNLTGDELHKASEKTITNMIEPFDQALFEAILVSILPDLAYAITPWTEEAGFDNSEFWKISGSFFNPRLTIHYAFSPLENKGIFINVTLPTQPVFYRMGIQFFVSVGITLLLIVCLIFQVRTILKQRKINEIRENFVHTMVHELKRPVQTLKTFVSFLNDKKMRADAEATEQVVRDSMFELDNLSAYLNKLKDMLHVDSETTTLQISEFNLRDLIEKVIRLIHIPPDKAVTISPVYETDELNMEADSIHLANVLSNLIENAIKYSGKKVHIEIKVGNDKRKRWISVKDNGIGIPVAEQGNVFAKFYRGNHILDKTIPGIGLGLSYVKLIVEAHQGSIQLNSQAGEGTTVTINLPQ
jgi:two-component system phosphate regulon sensor histidine kinase PhoR